MFVGLIATAIAVTYVGKVARAALKKSDVAATTA
jgi:hypothetical protein